MAVKKMLSLEGQHWKQDRFTTCFKNLWNNPLWVSALQKKKSDSFKNQTGQKTRDAFGAFWFRRSTSCPCYLIFILAPNNTLINFVLRGALVVLGVLAGNDWARAMHRNEHRQRNRLFSQQKYFLRNLLHFPMQARKWKLEKSGKLTDEQTNKQQNKR